MALQRLRRNKQLTQDDLTALEKMLLKSGAGRAVDIARTAKESDGLGLFVRNLVGLDRQAASEAFSDYLDGTRFTIDQVRFVSLIIDELTVNGVVEPSRLYESPYTDYAPQGLDSVFPDQHVDVLVEILHRVKTSAQPALGA